MKLLCGLIAFACLVEFGTAATMIRESTEKLLRCTYKIEGGGSSGAAFVLLEPYLSKTNVYGFLLITAAHVLEGNPTSDALLWTRTYDGTNYHKQPTKLVIRTNGGPVWLRHPSADVAVMRISLRTDADTPALSITALATDDYFRDFQISPADQLRVIGYPLNFEGLAGFGIVRNAPISSFPLSPAKKIQTYLLDFPTFPGNSGGPVFIAETRQLQDGSVNTVNTFRILGLVSLELSQAEAVKSLNETTVRQHKLGLAVVVHSELILDTIALLPKLE